MTIIEVSEITPPAYGKKKSKVTAADGSKYYGWPDAIGKMGLVPGGRYTIEFEESDFNGRKIRNITKATPVTNGHVLKSNGTTAFDVPPSAPSEQEFVTALLCAFITSRQMTPEAKRLIDATKILRDVYRQTFGLNRNAATEH